MMSEHRETALIAAAWERFVAGEDADLSILRPEIADSWRRCRDQHKLAPTTARVPDADKPLSMLDEDLKEASVPVVALIHEALEGVSVLVGVSNRDAELVHVVTDPRARAAAEQINAVAGSCWKESAGGTNSVGTGMVLAKPLHIRWNEHYLKICHDWNSCSAPILHPVNGSLLGAFGISGLTDVEDPRILQFSMHGAEMVTRLLASVQASDRLALVRAFDDFVRRYQDAALLAVDAYGYVTQTSAQAEEEVVRVDSRATGSRLSQLIGFAAIARLRDQDRPCELDIAMPSGAKATAHPVFLGTRMVGSIVVFTSGRRPAPRAPRADRTWSSRYTFADIVGDSPSIANAVRLATRAARTDYPVLLLGESGTGKELFAHAIHDLSPRRGGPFVAFNFGALSEELTISEMCGHEPGAFTGAKQGAAKPGIFDSAEAGTLLIDELQDAGPKAQSLLLRFLETHTFVRVGGTAPVQSDVRVIAASNASDQELARRVRPDLLYRLNSIMVRIPPLRERPDDIRPIAERHLRTLGFRGVVEPQVWERLMRHQWFGNVRELQNSLLRATLNCSGLRLTAEDLPPLGHSDGGAGPPAQGVADSDEAGELLQALREAHGNINQAARNLGIHRSTLYRRLTRLAIAH
jgi:transcriptional regulator of acetoin/glycerol metabolism